MFQFIKAHKDLLFDAEPVATVGLLHSAASRDFLDQGPVDTAFFVSAVNLKDNVDVYAMDKSFFWGASILDRKYCADYGGFFKALSHLHAPVAIVPLQAILDEDIAYLKSFKLLCLPSLQCVSEKHARAIVEYARAGGHVIATGPRLGWEDDLGQPRVEKLDEALKGIATARLLEERIGRSYFESSSAAALATLEQAVIESGARIVDMPGARHVHLELTRRAGATLVHLINYEGAPSRILGDGAGLGPNAAGYPFPNEYRVVPQTVTLDVKDVAPKNVRFVSPDGEVQGKWLGGGKLEVIVRQYVVCVLEP
jgi:hypothetical protein